MKKYRFLLLIVGLGALLLAQQKVIMPLVYDVIKSDAFLIESNDLASALPIANTLTALAFTHCNTHVKSLLGADTAVTFPDKPINVWSIGNYQYVINAEITIASNAAAAVKKKYVCRINYEKGDDAVGAEDFANWSIVGLSGLEDK